MERSKFILNDALLVSLGTATHLTTRHVDGRAIDDPCDALEVRRRCQRSLVRVVVFAQLLQAYPGQAVYDKEKR